MQRRNIQIILGVTRDLSLEGFYLKTDARRPLNLAEQVISSVLAERVISVVWGRYVFYASVRVEVVFGIQGLVAEKLEKRAVPIVRAGFGDGTYNAARGASVFRRVVVRDDLELLHRLGAHERTGNALGIAGQVLIGHAVEQEQVLRAHAACCARAGVRNRDCPWFRAIHHRQAGGTIRRRT